VKHLVAWILTGLWAVLLLWFAWGYLRYFTSNAGPANAEKLFAAVGAASIGLLPLYLAFLWHRWSQKRLHKTLTKKRDKIDRKLDRMGDKQPSAEPSVHEG